MPMRIQMSKGPWRAANPDAVVVARPSRWGNLFRAAVYGRELSLQLYAQALGGGWNPSLLDQNESNEYWDTTYGLTQTFRKRLGGGDLRGYVAAELRGKDLACCCPLDVPCHADVLLELANPAGRQA